MPLVIFKKRSNSPLHRDLFKGYCGDIFTHLSYTNSPIAVGSNRYQITYGVTSFQERSALLRAQKVSAIGRYRGDVFEAWRNAELVGVGMVRTARQWAKRGAAYQVKVMLHGLCFTDDAVDEGLPIELADSIVFNLAQDAIEKIEVPEVTSISIEIMCKPASQCENEVRDWIVGHLTFCAVSRLAAISSTSFRVISIR